MYLFDVCSMAICMDEGETIRRQKSFLSERLSAYKMFVKLFLVNNGFLFVDTRTRPCNSWSALCEHRKCWIDALKVIVSIGHLEKAIALFLECGKESAASMRSLCSRTCRKVFKERWWILFVKQTPKDVCSALPHCTYVHTSLIWLRVCMALT